VKLAQVALSCRDMAASRRWYADCFGYRPAGGLDPATLPDPPDIGAIQGIPGAAVKLLWAVDELDFFQLELFQYGAPEARPLAGRRACDVGYTTIGVEVGDFDAVLARTEPLSEPLGAAGGRRVCVRDPDGILVEVMEGTGGPVTRFVRASVPDLDRSLAYFADTLGLERVEPTLHGPEHEALWGLDGATRRVELLSAGGFLVELAQYEDPPPAPWPDGYRISDLGILNVALGWRDKDGFRATEQAVRAAGYHLDQEHDAGIGSTVYAMDDQGFSVELMYLDAAADAFAGFAAE
jgi:catechol 2,3-dioxygenase-like lactoylglutathione lyase family enzyme